MDKKIPLLTANDIEVKVKQCTENGAIALLYKTARVDMAILDEVFGAENWECDYKEIKGNLYCGIGVRLSTSEQFIYKWDCGIESQEDNDGNQKKGEASDAFKRAAFKWGIGRELYTAPFIFLSVQTKKVDNENSKAKPIYKLENKFARFECSEIEYDNNNKIKKVVIKDDKGKIVYPAKYVEKTEEPKPTKVEPPIAVAEKKSTLTIEEAENMVTSMGTKYSDLDKEQLTYAAQYSKGKFQEGAKLLLSLKG